MSEKPKRVGFSVQKLIRPIGKKKKTPISNNSDSSNSDSSNSYSSNSDSSNSNLNNSNLNNSNSNNSNSNNSNSNNFDLNNYESNSDSDYEELLPPPPSPPNSIPPMVPVPSKELLEIQEKNRLKREKLKNTYIPRIKIFYPENATKEQYYEIISRDFVRYLAQKGINIGNETSIKDLENNLKEMFSKYPIYNNKIVVGCDFYRIDGYGMPVLFNKNNKLETYSDVIRDWSSDKMSKNYFYINVYFRDKPFSMGGFRKRKRTMRKKNIRSSKTFKRR
jgi:hypothetical protein